MIRALSAADARALVEEALRLDSAEEVEALARIRVAELVPREPQAALGVCP